MFGLSNNGNTCYFNATIQSLLRIPDFTNFITNLNWIDEIKQFMKSRMTKEDFNFIFTINLYNLLVGDNSKIKNPINLHNSVTKFYNIIKKNNTNNYVYPFSEFRRGIQCDACDLLSAVLSILHTENSFVPSIKINSTIFNYKLPEYSDVDINTTDIPYSRDAITFFSYQKFLDTHKKSYSFIDDLFEGIYINITECASCVYKSFSFSCSYILDLDIINSEHNSPIELNSLEDCLNNQISENFYSDSADHKLKSGHPKNYHITQFWKCPKVLVIRLKRFSLKNNIKSKIDSPISIPTDLNIFKYVHMYSKNNTENYNYHLVAAIQHSGSCNGGHYFTYGLVDNDWYTFNDGSVSKVNGIPDLSYSYILFYLKN